MVLRHEPNHSLLTYAALSNDSKVDLSSGCRRFEKSTFDAYCEAFLSAHTAKVDFGDDQQEFLVLSHLPFKDYDRLVLDQYARCLSLAVRRKLSHS
jgi:hypothetical protein